MRTAEVVYKSRSTILLLGVGLSFATVPIPVLAFATLGLGLAELDVLSAFAWALTVVDVVVVGDIRGTSQGVVAVLYFVKLVLVTANSNPCVTERLRS